MCAVVWVAYGVTAGQQVAPMRCREHGCVDVCVCECGGCCCRRSYGACCAARHVVVVSHDSDDGCWCVHGVCVCARCVRVCVCWDWAVGGVCCLGCVDACLAGADLDWSTGRRGRVDWCGVTTGCRGMAVSARRCMTGGK